MRLLDALIGSQIRRPSGLLGRLLGHLMAQEHRPLTRWALDLLRPGTGDHLIDLGCGGGMAIRMAAEAAPGGRVIGLDYSRAMAGQARARNRALIAGRRAAVVQGSVAALPFPDGSFDHAYSIETFYFWPSPVADLGEVRRVLRPGGRVTLAMDISREGPDPAAIAANAERLGFTVYSREELETTLRLAGFTDVTTAAQPGRGKGWLAATGTRPQP